MDKNFKIRAYFGDFTSIYDNLIHYSG